MKRDLYFCGDIHGDYRQFIWNILTRYKIEKADVIVCGDFGVGFDGTLDQNYKWSEKRLEEADVTVWALRGNHDDPAYFTEPGKTSYPRLKFMKDYEVYQFCGEESVSVLVIGGANSVDITDRLKINQEYAAEGSDRRVWWENEDVTRVPLKKLPLKVDIICSHEAPIQFDPVLTRLSMCPTYQYEKISQTRKYLGEILESVNVSYWFYGHYHHSYSGSYNSLLWRCLDIQEIYMYPGKEKETIEDDK